MGNIYSINGSQPPDEWLSMSNGTTSAFIDLMALAAGVLAGNDGERLLAVCIAEEDQSVRGIGTVGFELSELPWDKDRFEKQRSFMLRVTEAAASGLGSECLGYVPDLGFLKPCFDKFALMLEKMTADDIDPDAAEERRAEAEDSDPERCGFPRCEKHGVYLTCFGCVICNGE